MKLHSEHQRVDGDGPERERERREGDGPVDEEEGGARVARREPLLCEELCGSRAGEIVGPGGGHGGASEAVERERESDEPATRLSPTEVGATASPQPQPGILSGWIYSHDHSRALQLPREPARGERDESGFIFIADIASRRHRFPHTVSRPPGHLQRPATV